jgi:carbon starvation protein
LSVLLGIVQRLLNPPLWLVTLIFVPATFGVAWYGTHISEALLLGRGTWSAIILLYCAVASVTPVWALLQPRGYLGGFVLYSALAVGVIGVFFGGHAILQPAFRTWQAGGPTGALFPFLFVTIACGACSGFHGLVCSGTTSKQIDRESHVRPVGYGAMLAEGFVALIALTTVMIAAPAALKGLAPGTIYGNGLGEYMTLLIGRENLPFAVTFGAMAFSTFVFDTLDVCTRLGRYILQELFGWTGWAGAVAGTTATVALPLLLLTVAREGMWLEFWTLFGASNQLLAGLTLLTVAVWLARSGKRIRFLVLPMVFVLGMTLTALVSLAVAYFRDAAGADIRLLNGTAALALAALAVFLVTRAVPKLRRARS